MPAGHRMQAFVIPRAGADTVEAAEVERPRPDADELLVRVAAIGVGVHDSSFLPHDARYPFPIGIEAAGVVEQVGSSVAGRQPGDRIAFVSAMQPKGGTWAQFVVVDGGAQIIPIPQGVDFVTAAAVPVAGNTALRALSVLAGTSSGRSLFVAGGSGAIGTFAVQLARRRGWRVAASASKRNHGYLRSLGAEKVVDYHDQDWTGEVREWAPGGVDAALAVQPGTATLTLPVVRDGGVLVPISGDSVEDERVRVEAIPHQGDVRAQLAQLMEDVGAGVVHVELEQVHPFEEALTALAKVQTRHARGKTVLRLGRP